MAHEGSTEGRHLFGPVSGRTEAEDVDDARALIARSMGYWPRDAA